MDTEKHACVNHPDREGPYYCSKYNQYLCEECLSCRDPNLFCKFRKSCLVWEVSRHPDEYFDRRTGADL